MLFTTRPRGIYDYEEVRKMKAKIVLRHWVVFALAVSVLTLAGLAPALADVGIANVREYEMRRHIERGAAALSDADDTYPQLGEALDNVASKGFVTWGDRARMERASLVKVKVRVADKEVLQAFGVREVAAVKAVSDPEEETGWGKVAFEAANGAAPPRAIIQVDNDGSAYQMITHVAIRKDGVLRRLPLREKGYAAYSITQNYFSYLAEAGKLEKWMANTLKPADGISILVIRRENRRPFQRWFTTDTLAQPDSA